MIHRLHKSSKITLIIAGFFVGAILILFLAIVLLQLVVIRITPANYLKEQEAFIIKPSDIEKEAEIIPVRKVLFEYIEIIGSCPFSFDGECLNARSGPGAEYPSVAKLRNGAVLKVGGEVERNGKKWYKIEFDEWLRYPDRVKGDLYVAADYVQVLLDEGNRNLDRGIKVSSKRIVVDRSEQMLYAYDGDELFMKAKISTGLEFTPTPQGTFTIFKKTPSRYMQGPIPGVSEKYYDLPGVPWNLYFTSDGAVIHGTYWHNNFGKPSSNGCVNLTSAEAKKLYTWAEVGVKVIVRN